MSERYPAGIITKNAVTPSGPYQNSTAPGIWTLDQQISWQKAGQWPTPGNLNPSLFIENLFSTYLYTGTGSAQTITNGIDLSTNGGLVWCKNRTAGNDHALYDTVRGTGKALISDTVDPQLSAPAGDEVYAFNSNGFSIGIDYNLYINRNTYSYVSWTFRKQPKFFDIVTYTGTGSATTIAHNLGSVPGCIMVKRTDTTGNWQVYHNGLTSAAYSMQLNLTNAQASAPTVWNSTAPTSSVFSIGTDATVNASGGTYVAYLFASNAGGFGSDGTQNVITCGTFTTSGGGTATVNLGYEPQWVMTASSSATDNWNMYDIMRGMPASPGSAVALRANLANAETSAIWGFNPTATGFTAALNASTTYIYIAIRRGPMATPTSGTSVFTPQIATSAGSASNTVTTNFPVSLIISQNRTGYFAQWFDRLRGDSQSTYVLIRSANTTGELTGAGGFGLDNNTGYVDNYDWQNVGGGPYVYWNFQRGPGFFDEVCWSGSGTAGRLIDHNLGVAPELIIQKVRSEGGNMSVWQTSFGLGNSLRLNGSGSGFDTEYFSSTVAPTSTQFKLNNVEPYYTNRSGQTYVAYLFATLAGVSKVGTYSGTGATQTINCGFTGGARFVLIKRTDTTGDWYVWDTARGMVAGTDPYLLLNSGVTADVNANNVYTTGVGFQIVSSLAGINASGGTYIFLAIA